MNKLAVFGMMVLAGCSASSDWSDLNPFGGSQPVPEQVAAKPKSDRVAIVESLEVGQSSNGVIVQATGLSPMPGYSRPELVLDEGARPGPDGVLGLDFVARPPDTPQPAAGDVGRRMTAALFIERSRLEGVRVIRVLGTEQSRDSGL